MKLSSRFINFASILSIITFTLCIAGCKGRTLDNVEPTGDTIEVVIMQPEEEVI